VLVYDQGQLDLINLTGKALIVSKMTFTDSTGREFDAETWAIKAKSESLQPQRCYQVYRASVNSIQPPPLGDCTFSRVAAFWVGADSHAFWVWVTPPGTPSTTPPTTFTVSIDGQAVATCPIILVDSGGGGNGSQPNNECHLSSLS
jgi:hypothetical protein